MIIGICASVIGRAVDTAIFHLSAARIGVLRLSMLGGIGERYFMWCLWCATLRNERGWRRDPRDPKEGLWKGSQ